MTPDWLSQILMTAEPLLPKNFAGRVELNIFKGGISYAKVMRSVWPEELEEWMWPLTRHC